MNKKLYFIFIAASFALLVSAPGRLAYGLVLIIEMNILAISASVFSNFMESFDLGNLHDVLTLSFVVFVTILYRQFLILFSPVTALTLGFVMYLPPISIYLFGNLFDEQVSPPIKVLKQTLVFSVFAFLFFLARDIIGYGTISVPVHNGIAEARLFDSYSSAFCSFFASVPGALLLTVFCMAGLLTVQYKMNIIEKARSDYASD